MTYRNIALVCCLLGLFACGSKTRPVTAPPLGPDNAQPTEPLSGSSNTSSNTLGNTQCEALLEHIFELIYVERSRELPEAQRPTPQDLDVAKDKLRSELLAECEGASPEMFHYDCTMAAVDRDAIEACLKSPP